VVGAQNKGRCFNWTLCGNPAAGFYCDGCNALRRLVNDLLDGRPAPGCVRPKTSEAARRLEVHRRRAAGIRGLDPRDCDD
jgi:hypothetical protein